MDSIKLIIWDLDDTFWSGTLSEEGISPIQFNIDLVKELTNRGVMNSISSKNDFHNAKAKLEELGVWDLFIFPQINWNPKGNNIQFIIESAQLRAVNVLFLDNEHLNLEEAKYYNKEIQAEGPKFIPDILKHKAFKGKDDKEHTRLKQYKILEEKQKEKQNYSDNTAFLEDSNIELALIDELAPVKDRILELINRTNQINYTKKRIETQELETLLSDPDMECKVLRVKDRFGEYGFAGFYAYHKKNHHLEHFVFSCRLMNLGIEQYMYAQLNYPNLKQVGDVATQLNTNTCPHWIKQVNDWNNTSQSNKKESTRIFLKGACDLKQMLHYMAYNQLEIKTEFNELNDNNHPVPKASTEVLLQSGSMKKLRKAELAKELPFLDTDAFETELFGEDYDILVYSLLIDYTLDLYQSKSTGEIVPYESYGDFNRENENDFVARCARNKFKGMNQEVYQRLKTEYEYIGQITEQKLMDNLGKIRKRVSKPIIFINGAEVDSPSDNLSEFGVARHRHEKMNRALEAFCSNHANTYILDVRKFVREKDINHSIRHYERHVYEYMATELAGIVGHINKKSLQKNIIRYNYERMKKVIYHTLKPVAKLVLSKMGLITD